MNTKKYLPLGSIVQIEVYDKDVMIIGYMCYFKDNNKIISADYCGIPLEEGYKEDNKILFFKENITNIIFMGYKTQDVVDKLKTLDETLNILNKCNSADDFFDKVQKRASLIKTNSIISNNHRSNTLKEEK